MRGPRQCLRVDVLPDIRQLAVPDGNGEDKMVLESLVRGFDFPLSPSFLLTDTLNLLKRLANQAEEASICSHVITYL